MNQKWIWSVTHTNVYWWREKVYKLNYNKLHNWQENYSWVCCIVHSEAQLYSEALLMYTLYDEKCYTTECKSI